MTSISGKLFWQIVTNYKKIITNFDHRKYWSMEFLFLIKYLNLIYMQTESVKKLRQIQLQS